MKFKTIFIRTLSLAVILALILLEIFEYMETGSIRFSTIPKTLIVMASLIAMFASTFISQIDSSKKAEMKAAYEKEAVYFEEEKLAKIYFYMGFRGWFTNNSHTAYYYMEKAAKATNNPRAESRAYFYIGRTALEEQKYSRAIENLEKATELDYSFSKAWSNLSTAYLAVGKTNEAKTACERGLLYSPQDPYLNSKIGDYYFSTGNYERALSAFSVTERALPKNSTAVMNMALAYAGLGDEENAKAKFNRAKMLGYDGSDSAWSQISILLSQNSVQTYDKVVHTGVFVLESSCDCIEDCTRSDVERFLENAFESEDDFILLTPPEAIQGVQFIQACGSDFGGFVQISVEQLDGRCILFERECEQSEIERMFLDLFDYKIIPDLSKFN